MIIEIALGIVLAIFILAFLRQILIAAGWLFLVAIAAAGVLLFVANWPDSLVPIGGIAMLFGGITAFVGLCKLADVLISRWERWHPKTSQPH
jgi:hypothetical protein